MRVYHYGSFSLSVQLHFTINLLFFIYIVGAYLTGVVFAFLGVGRWIYLKIKYRNAGDYNG